MGSEIAKLFVSLSLNASDFAGGVRSAERDLDSLSNKAVEAGRKVADLGKKLTLGVTAPLVGAGIAAVNSASDQAEALSAVNTVYGDAAKDVKGYSGSVAKDLGLTRTEALSAATGFGVFAKGAGLAEGGAAEFSNELVGASADLASFYNDSAPEVLDAIKAGLTGETEPLRKYGIMMNDAAIQQYALTEGIWDGSGAMTEQQKILARQGFIMANLGDAQGDFARTQGGIANRWRVMQARAKDFAATVGGKLMPVAEQAMGWAERFIGALERLSPGMLKVGLVIAGVVAAIGPLLMVLGYLTMAFGVLLGPIGLVVAAIALLALAWNKDFLGIASRTTEFVEDLIAVFNRLTGEGVNPVSAAIRAFGSAFEDLTGLEVSDFFYDLAEAVDIFMSSFAAFRDAGLGPIAAAWMALGDAIGSLVGVDVSAWFNATATAVSNLWSSLTSGDWAGAIDALKELGDLSLTAVISIGTPIWGGIKGIAGSVWDWAWSQVVSTTQTGDGTGGPGMQGQEFTLGNWTLDLPKPGMDVTFSDVIGWIDETIEQIVGVDVELQDWKMSLANPDGDLTLADVAGWVDTMLEGIIGVDVELQSWTLGLANPENDLTVVDVIGWIDEALESLAGIDVELQTWTLKVKTPSSVDMPTVADLIAHIDASLEAMVGIDIELQNWSLDVGNPLNIDLLPGDVIGWLDAAMEGLIGVDIEMQDWTLHVGLPDIDFDFSPVDIAEAVVDYVQGAADDSPTLNPIQIAANIEPIIRGGQPDLSFDPYFGQFPDPLAAAQQNTDTQEMVKKVMLDTTDFDAKFSSLQQHVTTFNETPAKATFAADTGPAALAYTEVMTWAGVWADTPHIATFDVDHGPAAVKYTEAFSWGDTFAATTWTGAYDLDIAAVVNKYTESFRLGDVFAGTTWTGTFDIDNGPAAVAYTDAFGWGGAWASQTFTARFSVDTSGLRHAVDVARWAAGEIAALLPNSPAKKGPLRKEPSFAYIADIARRDLAPLTGIISGSMEPPRIPRRPSRVPGLSRFETAADRTTEEHHHWTINAEFGTGEDWDRFFDTNQRQARLASVRGG